MAIRGIVSYLKPSTNIRTTTPVMHANKIAIDSTMTMMITVFEKVARIKSLGLKCSIKIPSYFGVVRREHE